MLSHLAAVHYADLAAQYGSLYAFVDLTEKPAFVQTYKIQPYKRVTPAQYWSICKMVIRNQLLVSLPLTALSAGPLAKARGMGDTSYEGLPGAWATLGTYAFCLMCEECGFYAMSVTLRTWFFGMLIVCSHRTLHHPSLYKHFHKQHHVRQGFHLVCASSRLTAQTFTAPVAMAATYATMTEHALSNLFPILLGVFVLKSHWSMIVRRRCPAQDVEACLFFDRVMFFTMLTLGTLDTHSGYVRRPHLSLSSHRSPRLCRTSHISVSQPLRRCITRGEY